MKKLYFWHVELSLADALAVTDSSGTLYYLSLGKWSKLVDLVKKDFHCVRKEYLIVPGKDTDSNSSIIITKNKIKQALNSPREIDAIRQSLLYKYIFGTASQRKVWDYLVSDVTVGKTSTYSDVASAVGKTGSARVIGNACGANRIALFVPCHRILTISQTITGYRYGLPIKMALISQERAPS